MQQCGRCNEKGWSKEGARREQEGAGAGGSRPDKSPHSTDTLAEPISTQGDRKSLLRFLPHLSPQFESNIRDLLNELDRLYVNSPATIRMMEESQQDIQVIQIQMIEFTDHHHHHNHHDLVDHRLSLSQEHDQRREKDEAAVKAANLAVLLLPDGVDLTSRQRPVHRHLRHQFQEQLARLSPGLWENAGTGGGAGMSEMAWIKEVYTCLRILKIFVSNVRSSLLHPSVIGIFFTRFSSQHFLFRCCSMLVAWMQTSYEMSFASSTQGMRTSPKDSGLVFRAIWLPSIRRERQDVL